MSAERMKTVVERYPKVSPLGWPLTHEETSDGYTACGKKITADVSKWHHLESRQAQPYTVTCPACLRVRRLTDAALASFGGSR